MLLSQGKTAQRPLRQPTLALDAVARRRQCRLALRAQRVTRQFSTQQHIRVVEGFWGNTRQRIAAYIQAG